MNQDDLRDFERRCTQDSPPRCQARCPLHVDVRGFIREMREGRHQAARNILERQLPFPAILGRVCDHPCEEACPRRELGGAIAVGDLERHCLEQAKDGLKGLPRPKKAKKAAVFGAGPAGLTVAWDLAGKGYAVAVFHAGEAPAADLRRIVDASLMLRGRTLIDVLPDRIIEEEFSRLEARGAAFLREKLSRSSLDARSREYDGVFVDAACAPELCPKREQVNGVTGSVDEHRFCFGGWGDSLIGMVFEGRRGAVTLERVLGGLSPLAARDGEGAGETRLFTPVDGIAFAARMTDDGGRFARDDAIAEARRCLLCECMACVRECAYLQHFQSYPKAYARQIFLNVTMVKGHRVANRLINSCCLCGQCRENCPQEFSMADLCLRGRREMVANGHMPPSAHEFALNDMKQANGPECRLAKPDPGGGCKRVFFPGCQLSASREEQVLRTFRHLRENLEGGVGIWLGCCGAPAAWAGRDAMLADGVAVMRRTWEELGRPEIVAACASCLSIFRRELPDIPATSLWEVLNNEAPPPKPAESFSRLLTVNDPCAARHDSRWLTSVRGILNRQGATFTEPRVGREKTACCGYGGLVWNANPAVAAAVIAQRSEELENDALSSCIMCRDRLAGQGKASWHVLDVVWPETAIAPHHPGPGLSARRFARARLRKNMLNELYHEGSDAMDPVPGMRIVVAEELLSRLESRHILVEDIEEVVKAAESGGRRFVDKNTGRILSGLRLGNVTFWVEYERRDSGEYAILDAYCHRMTVPGPATAAAEGET